MFSFAFIPLLSSLSIFTDTLLNCSLPECQVSIERKFALPYRCPLIFESVPSQTVCIPIAPSWLPLVFPALFPALSDTFPATYTSIFLASNPTGSGFGFFIFAADSPWAVLALALSS